jgi:hypothetical protein
MAVSWIVSELVWAINGFDSLQRSDSRSELRVQNAPIMLGANMVKIARDYFGNPKLLIPAEEAGIGTQETQRLTSGLSISLETFPSDGGVAISYFVLSSERNDVDDLFALMAQDICSHIIQNPDSTRFSVIGDRIKSWQELLSKFTEREPTLSQQLGLLGELFALDLLAKEIGPEALSSWFGPSGARHDFQTSNWGLEVKSTFRVAKKSPRIHGLLQLEPAPETTLRLLLLQFDRSLGGVTIEKLIHSIQANLPSAKIEEVLAEFMPSGVTELPTWTANLEVRLIFGTVYVVDEIFPRMRSGSLGNNEKRFSKIEYDLDLEGLPHTSITASDPMLGSQSW